MKEINELPISQYEWIFNINKVNRPTNFTLEKVLLVNSDVVKEELLELVSFWDSYFGNCQSELMKHQVEEWVETASLFKEALAQIPNIFIKLPDEKLPKELKNLPYLGHIPGRNPDRFEQNNNLNNDLVFPELQPFLGREIALANPSREEILYKSNQMIEKYGACCLKWLKRAKIYPVKICKTIEEVERYLALDPYMLYMQENNLLTIQEALSLQYETRFFVVGGKRAGQSLIRYNLTPLHERYYIPDQFLQVYKLFIETYQEVVSALKNGNSLQSHSFVVDLAWDEKNKKVVVVELNSIHNSGLYNTNPSLLVSLAKENPKDFILRD